MTFFQFTPVVMLIATAAGVLGALTGLGGAAIVTPALTLLLGVDIHYAIGASLVSVIATSSGAAAAFVRDGYSNIRVGLFLEIATTLGALLGAFIATRTSAPALISIFGLMLLHSAWKSSRERGAPPCQAPDDPLARTFQLTGSVPECYSARRVKTGFSLMFAAGTASGLLGIGSGPLKVIAMDQAMQLPFRVSTATSNFMIGVTAAATAGVYLSRGYIDASLDFPVILGALIGSTLGARLLPRIRVSTLRRCFACIAGAVGVEMIVKGIAAWNV